MIAMLERDARFCRSAGPLNYVIIDNKLPVTTGGTPAGEPMHIRNPGRARCVLPACVALTLTGTLALDCVAQPYPAGPIRMVVPFTPGSASDILARLIQPKLLESWGQQIVVDNRPSAGGTVAGSIVATAVPDGYTLMLTSSGFAGSAALYDKLPYDSVKDFSGVTQVVSTPLVLVVAPGLGTKSTKELIALAQQKPVSSISARRASAAARTTRGSSSSSRPASTPCTCPIAARRKRSTT